MTEKTRKSTYVVGGLKGEPCRDRIKSTISSLDGVDNYLLKLLYMLYNNLTRFARVEARTSIFHVL